MSDKNEIASSLTFLAMTHSNFVSLATRVRSRSLSQTDKGEIASSLLLFAMTCSRYVTVFMKLYTETDIFG